MQATIRLLRREDNPVIAAIIRAVLTEFNAARPGTVYYDPTTDDLYKLFQTANAEYWVLEADGRVVGGSGVYPTEGLPDGCCELVKLYILPEARGKGFGKRLIEQCFASAANFGYKQVYLETMPELKSAMSLYERCGFEYLKGPLGNSGHFGCGLWMLKTL
ncbi:MAG: family N-acetyltransferase [Flavipsychrobacter sp.]|jgi:putative acetyltransferase|nr:family N-acetyltransferase [Flavipsychrobacter sp.]